MVFEVVSQPLQPRSEQLLGFQYAGVQCGGGTATDHLAECPTAKKTTPRNVVSHIQSYSPECP